MTTIEHFEEAEAQRRRGDERGAEASYLLAVEAAHAEFNPGLECRALLALGELRLIVDDPTTARRHALEAIGRAMEAGDLMLEAEGHFLRACSAFDAGWSKEGHAALLDALVLYHQVPGEDAKLKYARALRIYGEFAGVLGSEPGAREALEAALAVADDDVRPHVLADLEAIKALGR